MTTTVFISHSSKDHKAALTLCAALENRGLGCWIAPRDIPPGKAYQGEIVRAIRSAKVLVLVFTSNANSSNEIVKELALASQNGLVVIPVRTEDVIPNDDLAYELVTRQWIDAFSGWEDAIARIARQIRAIINIETLESSPQPRAPSVSTPVAPRLAAVVETGRASHPEPLAAALAPESAANRVARAQVTDGQGPTRHIKIWNVADGQLVRTLEVAGSTRTIEGISDLAFSPDGTKILTSGTSKVLQVTNCKSGQLDLRLEGIEELHSAVAYSPDGKLIAAIPGYLPQTRSLAQTTAELWDSSSAQRLYVLTGSPSYSLAFSPDSKWLALGQHDGIIIWDIAQQKCLHRFSSQGGLVRALMFSPEGAHVVAGHQNGSVVVWDVMTEQVSRTFWHLGTVFSVAYSPDGTRIIAGGFGGSIPIWSAESGRRLRTLKEDYAKLIPKVAFSPDGSLIAAAVGHGIFLWSSESGERLQMLWNITKGKKTEAVGSVAFSPDGKFIAADSATVSWPEIPNYWSAFALFASGFLLLLVNYFAPDFLHFRPPPPVFVWGAAVVCWFRGISMFIRAFNLRSLQHNLEG